MTEEADGLAIARRCIAEEAEAQRGFLDLGRLGLAELPEELFTLKHLRRLNLGAGYRTENGQWIEAQSNIAGNKIQSSLAGLTKISNLRSLDCANTDLSELRPLAELSLLQSLNCSRTLVTDLSPLSGLASLQSLYCAGTSVSDLDPLSGLASLQSLNCARTPVSDLGPLSALASLQSLNCTGTSISDLGPLSGLASLQSLYCPYTPVSDLSPLSGLSSLQSFSCCGTSVSDLGPLSRLASLQSLDCSWTSVYDLGPLSGFLSLQSLDCSGTSVSDLGPLLRLASLRQLYCRTLNLVNLPRALIDRSGLEVFSLIGGSAPGIPSETLFDDDDGRRGNCLPALRAHLADLAVGTVAIPDIKLMVLGNGRVGKTQICNRLRDLTFEADADSTHGIVMASADLPLGDDAAPARLNIWDFGGQDIYHGTHALFLRANAVFVLVWAPESEAASEHVHDGMNRPLAYWLDCVRPLGGKSAPVLVVQTRCDRPENEVLQPPLDLGVLTAFSFRQIRHYSALNDRGRASLDEALGEAVRWLRQREGIATMGVGRHRVKRRREADLIRQPGERKDRTITQMRFLEICTEEGGVSSPSHLLDYLHNAGIVFYRKGLFEDRIVLDQAWALDAIYAIFNRTRSILPLRKLRGRFNRALLETLVWEVYGEAEQEMFLGMMESCGICFKLRDGGEAEYLAPEFLPPRADVAGEIAALWLGNKPEAEAVFDYDFLMPGLMNRTMAAVGRSAGVSAVFWQGGVCAYETGTCSHALIEQESTGEWRGRLRLQTRGPGAQALLPKLVKIVEEAQRALDLNGRLVSVAPVPQTCRVADQLMLGRAIDETLDEPKPAFGPPPRAPGKRFYVSYAWKDDKTPEGEQREADVDRLCAEADNRGLKIIRDKTALSLGDSIQAFMDEIAAGDRVFVFLSDKYLRSINCMYELFAIWRESRRNEKAFLGRLRICRLPCAKIWDMNERFNYAAYWMKQYDSFRERARENPGILAARDLERFKLMSDFAHRVGDVLDTIADHIQPRNFDEFVRTGLTED
jgi:internalin A